MDQSYIKKSCLKTTTLELLIDVVTLERETTGSPLVRQHVSEATRSEWLDLSVDIRGHRHQDQGVSLALTDSAPRFNLQGERPNMRGYGPGF